MVGNPEHRVGFSRRARKIKPTALLAAVLAVGCTFFIPRGVFADPLNCSLAHYKALPGLEAAIVDNTLTVLWEGDDHQELRLRFTINDGTPTIQQLAIRRQNAAWVTLANHLTPEFHVVSGLRRITNQQLDPLAGLGVKITQEVIDREKWKAFWDAPLNVPGGEPSHNNNTPPQRGALNQPGLPRSPSEVKRATAIYRAQSCEVVTNGARLEVSFPGVQLGVFEGRLHYTVYKGTNLIRQEIIAKTDELSVAYKYDAGLRGMEISPASKPSARVAWRDVTNQWQEYRFGGLINDGPVTVKASNRLLAAEVPGGSIATFPPPHNFFWARETSYNLGYNWYRKDSASSFAFGVRQPESEESAADEARGPEDRRQNFALRNARPGTWQRMPVYFYVSAADASHAVDSALAFTRGDHFQPLPGYQVMATHFHMGLVERLRRAGRLDSRVPDLEVLKAAGINIAAPIDGGPFVSGFESRPPGSDDPKWFQWSQSQGAAPASAASASGDREREGGNNETANPEGASYNPLQFLADYYEAARRQSDQNFMVMPNTELLSGRLSRAVGGHTDILLSHPVFWLRGRENGQPLVEDNPVYGRVYHLGSPADMMEMASRENMLLYMPHPRSKGSTGFPDAIKDTPQFLDENYRGIGFRWGMGLDGSEQRLSEYRCLPLFDDMNNWVADKPTPPKYIEAISEIYQQGYGDDIYANNPVNYVKLKALPKPDDWTSIVDAMKRGDYFVTSGEVLIPSYQVAGTGTRRIIVAEVQWTFPLEFVEVVWGDGEHTDRKIISATGLPPFGSHRFEIPFTTDGKKWVRFAAWDSAGNGALVQPIKLVNEPSVKTVNHVKGKQAKPLDLVSGKIDRPMSGALVN